MEVPSSVFRAIKGREGDTRKTRNYDLPVDPIRGFVVCAFGKSDV